MDIDRIEDNFNRYLYDESDDSDSDDDEDSYDDDDSEDDDSDQDIRDFMMELRLPKSNFDMNDRQLRCWQRKVIRDCEYENLINAHPEYMYYERTLQERINDLKDAIRDTYSRRTDWHGRRRGEEDFFA